MPETGSKVKKMSHFGKTAFFFIIVIKPSLSFAIVFVWLSNQKIAFLCN